MNYWNRRIVIDHNTKHRSLFVRQSLWERVRRYLRAKLFGRF